MQDLPFQNPFRHSKSNLSTYAVSFSLNILLYIFITCIKWANRENIFKPTIGNESLHQHSNDNGVRIVTFATLKNLVLKSTMFPH